MSLFKISLFVIFVHAVILLWGIYHQPPKSVVNRAPTRVLAKEVTLGEEVSSSLAAEKKIEEEPKKVKKEEKQKPVAKPVKKNNPPAEKKIIKDPALVAKAKENIAKITKTSDKTIPSGNKDSAKITNKAEKGAPRKEEAAFTPYEAGYRDELANRLKLLLRLPEYGCVKVRLTINRKGIVDKVEIVAAESEVNKKYIEGALPELLFPPLGNNFIGEPDHTFLITLNNEL
jgi:colicin import membrane protein